MRIFIGGGKTKHNDRFSSRYPEIVFAFASEDDSPRQWVRRAQYCDVAIVLQHRTSHKHTDCLKANHVTVQFTDSIPTIHILIQQAIAHGSIGNSHSYTGRSESDPQGTAGHEAG